MAPAGDVEMAVPTSADEWLGRTVSLHCGQARTRGGKEPELGIVISVKAAASEEGHTIEVAYDISGRQRMTVKMARAQLAPVCKDSLRVIAKVTGGKYKDRQVVVIGMSKCKYKLYDTGDDATKRVFSLRHDRCLTMADNGAGKARDDGWLGALMAGVKIWQAVPTVVSEAALEEAEAILPAEARYPGLQRKGVRGPERLATYIGKAKKAGKRRMRWDKLEAGGETDLALRDMVVQMSGVLASTSGTRASNWHGYKRHIETWDLTCPLLPLCCEGVGTWLIRRWWIKGSASSLSVTGGYVSSLIAYAREAGYHRNAKRPGIEDYEYTRLKRLMKVLDDLEDGGKKKSFPLLLSMVSNIKAVMGDTIQDRRNLARLVIACICALRGQDHKKGRLRKRNLKKVRGEEAWELHVMPGKRHSSVVPTRLTPIMEEGSRASLTLDPGRIVTEFWKELGFEEQEEDAMLFPAIRDGEIIFDEHMNDEEFLTWIRDMLLRAGYPADIVRRVTLHSPRSGAATDWFAAGVKLEIIKKQGRWKSDAVLLYLRLTLLSVGEWMGQVLSQRGGSKHEAKLAPLQDAVEAARERGDALLDSDGRKHEQVLRISEQRNIGSDTDSE